MARRDVFELFIGLCILLCVSGLCFVFCALHFMFCVCACFGSCTARVVCCARDLGFISDPLTKTCINTSSLTKVKNL